jgi:hypothetical protein
MATSDRILRLQQVIFTSDAVEMMAYQYHGRLLCLRPIAICTLDLHSERAQDFLPRTPQLSPFPLTPLSSNMQTSLPQ